MTAISALISKDWIVSASDSLLTEFYPDSNEIKHIEFKKSKIIPVRKFKAAISYWGLAKIKSWRTYDFIKELASNADSFNTFEEFANNLKTKLQEKLDSITFQNQIHKGIGIHIIGYEHYDNDLLPELFLISNYTDTSYTILGDLRISRNLYITLPDEFKNNENSLEEKQRRVMEFLNQGRFYIFNNGDPMLFNPAAYAIHNMFNTAVNRKVLKQEQIYNLYMKLASRPIEIIKEVQHDFFKKDCIRIGGKIHHLLITKQGKFISDTEDNNF